MECLPQHRFLQLKGGKTVSLPNEFFRFKKVDSKPDGAKTDYRSEYSRDYARVLHSPSFRRLQNKTQLFPGQESDFFRNRLTHSLEVSQIAKSIATKLISENQNLPANPEVCEIAGLIHDIGHPPFGHNGEAALDECMISYGGFEGNAQTLRVIARLEKKEQPDNIIDECNNDCRIGLNLTARVIASVIKYDQKIPVVRIPNDYKFIKGYYASESNIVEKVKECLIDKPSQISKRFKTIECAIMDIADDIAYSTYDVEDAFKAEFLTPYDIVAADESIFEQICTKLQKDNIKNKDDTEITVSDCRGMLLTVFADMWQEPINNQKGLISNDEDFEYKTVNNLLDVYSRSKRLAKDGYFRTMLTSAMVNSFINGVHVEIDEKNPVLSEVYLDKETLIKVNILKHFSYVVLINSSRFKVFESRGKEIVTKMFEKLADTNGHVLLPEDMQLLYNLSNDALWQKRVICDFIAGMTDRYALEFYGRLFSENPQTIFKPL